uniref:THAP-type domain-containing protein n=1 Tax=Schizaphis graminum TaxID=13262 RepID=A0A2S2PC23_SCHGA
MKIAQLENEDPQIVYNKKRICGAHFTSDCLSPGTKRLNCNSYPTLNITAVDNSSCNELLYIDSENIVKEVNLPSTSSTNIDLSGFDVLDTPSQFLRMYIIIVLNFF